MTRATPLRRRRSRTQPTFFIVVITPTWDRVHDPTCGHLKRVTTSSTHLLDVTAARNFLAASPWAKPCWTCRPQP